MAGKDEMVKELKGLNPKNFKVLNPYYTKDDKKVYFSKEYADIQELQNVDVKSFEALHFENIENKDDFGKDKNKVYLFGLELKDIKPEKFQVVKEPITEKIIYVRDENNLFVIFYDYFSGFNFVKTKKFENILIKKNIEYKIFDEVEVDPSFEVVNKALNKVIDFLPDIIVGIGGGSSLDTAKSIKYFIKKSNLHIPLIALPTTSGTGSEVTSYAVLTDKKNNIKIPLKDDEMIPEYAILDPDLTKTLPKSVVADSGIDALTHAIESYTCKGANFYTKMYALSAIRLIFKNLLRMYRDIKDEEARTEMAKASCIAGFAFEKSGLGINHSVAHAIGGKFHIAHGKINGIILPYVIRFNSEDKTTAQRYYEISKDLGFPANSIEEGAESLALAVELLNKSLNLPSCVKDLAIDEEKYRNEIEFMSKSALEDICTSGNIREVNLEDLKKLFKKVYG